MVSLQCFLPAYGEHWEAWLLPAFTPPPCRAATIGWEGCRFACPPPAAAVTESSAFAKVAFEGLTRGREGGRGSSQPA